MKPTAMSEQIMKPPKWWFKRVADKRLRERLMRLRPFEPELLCRELRNALGACSWANNRESYNYWEALDLTCGNHLLRPDWAELPDDWEPDAPVDFATTESSTY